MIYENTILLFLLWLIGMNRILTTARNVTTYDCRPLIVNSIIMDPSYREDVMIYRALSIKLL